MLISKPCRIISRQQMRIAQDCSLAPVEAVQLVYTGMAQPSWDGGVASGTAAVLVLERDRRLGGAGKITLKLVSSHAPIIYYTEVLRILGEK